MIYLGSDHAGLELKKLIQKHLQEKGEKEVDLGAFKIEPPTDYPEIAHEVAEKVVENQGSKGILVCGTGIGMCMAANKHAGVRGANCESKGTVEMSRKHNDSNVLCLGGRVLDTKTALEMVDTFLDTKFETEERHVRRVQKIEKPK
ncbi:ribose 5-phosphate isomerase B [Candidatus Peregrinibacteria bacterium]|nr:ribose 5-phosphate isomerase B [Candidatus Peregrinibacteria bacterium]